MNLEIPASPLHAISCAIAGRLYLILPADIPAHPYVVAMEAAILAPKAEGSMFPCKEPKERIPLAVREIRSFLRASSYVCVEES